MTTPTTNVSSSTSLDSSRCTVTNLITTTTITNTTVVPASSTICVDSQNESPVLPPPPRHPSPSRSRGSPKLGSPRTPSSPRTPISPQFNESTVTSEFFANPVVTTVQSVAISSSEKLTPSQPSSPKFPNVSNVDLLRQVTASLPPSPRLQDHTPPGFPSQPSSPRLQEISSIGFPSQPASPSQAYPSTPCSPQLLTPLSPRQLGFFRPSQNSPALTSVASPSDARSACASKTPPHSRKNSGLEKQLSPSGSLNNASIPSSPIGIVPHSQQSSSNGYKDVTIPKLPSPPRSSEYRRSSPTRRRDSQSSYKSNQISPSGSIKSQKASDTQELLKSKDISDNSSKNLSLSISNQPLTPSKQKESSAETIIPRIPSPPKSVEYRNRSGSYKRESVPSSPMNGLLTNPNESKGCSETKKSDSPFISKQNSLNTSFDESNNFSPETNSQNLQNTVVPRPIIPQTANSPIEDSSNNLNNVPLKPSSSNQFPSSPVSASSFSTTTVRQEVMVKSSNDRDSAQFSPVQESPDESHTVPTQLKFEQSHFENQSSIFAPPSKVPSVKVTIPSTSNIDLPLGPSKTLTLSTFVKLHN